MAGAVGLEPTTAGVTTRCTCLWRFTPIAIFCTCDNPHILICHPTALHIKGESAIFRYNRSIPAHKKWIYFNQIRNRNLNCGGQSTKTTFVVIFFNRSIDKIQNHRYFQLLLQIQILQIQNFRGCNRLDVQNL